MKGKKAKNKKRNGIFLEDWNLHFVKPMISAIILTRLRFCTARGLAVVKL